MEDPAYTLNDEIVWQGELPFLLRIAHARRAVIPPAPTTPLEGLNAVCR